MKKILSTLVICLILGVGALYSQGTVTVWAYANVNTKSQSNLGGGTVQAHATSRDGWANSTWNSGPIGSSSPIVGREAKGGIIGAFKYKVSYSADAYPNNGYYFSHWLNENNTQLTGKGDAKNGIKDIEHSWVGSGNKDVRVFAIFKPVTVKGVNSVTNISTADLGTTGSGTITFNVANADATDDFIATISGAGYSCEITNYASNVITVTVTYTDQNIHGNPATSAQVTLISRGDANSKATATITASSDLTPTFTGPANYDFGEIYTGDTKGSYNNLFVVTKNKAASQNSPTASDATGATWTATITGDDASAFELKNEHPSHGECVVTFNPEQVKSYEATLELTVSYTDSKGTTVPSTTTYTKLTGSAIAPVKSAIEFNPTSCTFDPVLTGDVVTKQVQVSQQNVSDVIYSFGTGLPSDFPFTVATAAGSVTITAKPVAPGTFNATLTATGSDTRDGHAGETTTGTLPVSITVGLQSPILVGGSNLTNTHYLKWTKVPCATGYKVYEVNGGTKTLLTTTLFAEDATHITHSIAASADKIYVVEAISTYGGGNYTSLSNQWQVDHDAIAIGNTPYLDLYTGTEKNSTTFPYRPKEKVDLSATFDAEGNALFDKLYIFGMTTNVDGGDQINQPSNVIPCNAKTLCYVYKKSTDGAYYEYETMFDAVSTRFDFDGVHDPLMNGKHLYFTGYCPFAYMGVNSTEEGWMYFKDDGNEKERTVDIYLDNCEIMGRYKTPTGKNADYNPYTLILTADIGTLGGTEPNNSFLFGASSPFIFTSARISSSEPYQPTIHIAGQNHLQGQLGSLITNTEGHVDLGITSVTMDPGINNVYTYSAPITIKPLDLSTFTDLVMTDIWKDNTITNGYLKLDATKPTNSNAEKVVAIDLGSKNGSLTINGGQYHLRNSAADGTYACNLAIGYRRFSKLVEKDVPIVGAVKVLLHLYGFGGDVADCKVIINSGTFTMYKNMYMSGTTPLGSEYYKDLENFLDLRLPAGEGKSQINGGTFNGISNVLMCSRVITTGASPENARGNWLCLQDVTIPVENQQPNGTATFDIPDPFHKGYGSDPKAVCYNMTNGDLVVQGREYGAQSLNFYEKDIDGDSENEKVVSLLLPGQACRDDCVDCEYQKEAIIFQWATAIPRFQAAKTVNGKVIDINVGGSINVEETPLGEDMEYKTTQLLYMDCAGMENYSMNLAAQGATLTFDDPNLPRGQVGNEKDYWILRHLNILKSVQADTWYTFTAPFDVHDISVIETNENTIMNEGNINGRSKALELQAQDNLRLLYGWQDVLIPNEEGRASSFTLEALLGARRKKLVHYDGTNIMAANYYLYELENEVFPTTGTGKNLAITWQPVKRNNAGDPLMYQGKTYAIQFPWCPMCNDLDTRTYYDYWSNKLILFHGKGPQTVLGTTGQSSLSTAPAAGSATLAGNSTLADMTLAKNTAYVHNMTNDYFELNNAQYVVKPTEGFLLYNPGASPMPARISRSGKIEYDENVETGVDGVPTVGDRTSLMLFGAYDGFEILSLCEQLVTVYNLQGNIIFQQYMAEGEQVYVGTGAGIFVVRGESETIKVMVE